VALSDTQIAELQDHYELLQLWNRKINLTSIPSGREAVIRHYCESLYFAANLPAKDDVSVADMGSGAGFPGIPLAILKPEWTVTLIESHQRKAVFLKEATRHLKNTAVIPSRAKDVKQAFKFLVSRAVNPDDVVANVPRLASAIGLMLGEDDWQRCKTNPAIVWNDPIRLPWGDRRLCAYGVRR
jgi:16S rRNA (guanine(527)-N(7))-methyltransferase RsmG